MKKAYIALAGVIATVASTVYTEVTHAYMGAIVEGARSAKGADQPTDLFGQSGTFQTITNVLLYIIGAVAVIMIVIGGIRYVISGGDSNQITSAKNTILYAIIGIIVALLAYAIVNFVLGSFAPSAGSGTNV